MWEAPALKVLNGANIYCTTEAGITATLRTDRRPDPCPATRRVDAGRMKALNGTAWNTTEVFMQAKISTTTFDSKLRNLIPASVSEFPKLETGQPYHFDHWADDRSGSSCLYYWFSSHDGTKRNLKRVIVSEIHSALQHLINTGAFDRNSFRAHCPKSESSGRCGFVVMGRILEALGVAVYSGREKGFVKPTSPAR